MNQQLSRNDGSRTFLSPAAEGLKESNIPGNSVLDENSKPFDDPDCDSFSRKEPRPADLLEAKSIDCMASNPSLLTLSPRDEPCTA
jgi:hypothetical protein